MQPVLKTTDHISAHCPDCDGAYSTFQQVSFANVARRHRYSGVDYSYITLYQCISCGRGGLSKIHSHDGNPPQGNLESFYPFHRETAAIPTVVPADIVAEYREAELCASFAAWRASSALLRSTLEKILRSNGYTTGSLYNKIDAAAADTILTETRHRRAHDEIRVLGNDVLHDDWRVITQEEVELAHHYIQRILEDFYDDR